MLSLQGCWNAVVEGFYLLFVMHCFSACRALVWSSSVHFCLCIVCRSILMLALTYGSQSSISWRIMYENHPAYHLTDTCLSLVHLLLRAGGRGLALCGWLRLYFCSAFICFSRSFAFVICFGVCIFERAFCRCPGSSLASLFRLLY